jgi:uncharacterized phage-associated protein
MITATQVAAYIESRIPGAWGWKTQKLLYLSQAWSLGINGRPIFGDTIEAWRDGPVVRGVWVTQKYSQMPEYHGELDDDSKSVIDAVLARYGAMAPTDLINLTHKDAPWIVARGGVSSQARTNTPIDMAAVKRLYLQRSLEGKDVPVVQIPMAAADDDSVAEVGRQVVEKWKSALDLLATR